MMSSDQDLAGSSDGARSRWAGAGPEGPNFVSSSRETGMAIPTSAIEEERENIIAAGSS